MGVPALFRVKRTIAGDSHPTVAAFMQIPDGLNVRFRAGQRYTLLLKPASILPFETPGTRGRIKPADFEVILIPKLSGFPVESADEEVSVGRLQIVWTLPKQTPQGIRKQVLVLLKSEAETDRTMGTSLLLYHGELWTEEFRKPLVHLLHWKTNFGMDATELLALHPGPESRQWALSEIRDPNSDHPQQAVFIAGADTDSTVQALLERVATGESGLAWMATLVLNPDRYPSHRRALVAIASSPPRFADLTTMGPFARQIALWRLCADTTKTMKAAIYEFIRAQEGREVLCPCLTDSQVHEAMALNANHGSPDEYFKVVAGDLEALRRHDQASLPELRRRLEGIRSRTGGDPPSAGGVETTLKEFFWAEPESAFAICKGLALTGPPSVRTGAVQALLEARDPRAASVARDLSGIPCDPAHYDLIQAISSALAQYGNSGDSLIFRKWAKECDFVRANAIQGMGLTCGLDAMAQLIDEVIGPDAELAVVRSYQMMGAKVRDMLAGRAAAKAAPSH